MVTNKRATICWSCAKACGDCSWSDHWQHKPVDGWVAVPTVLKGNYEMCNSYIVYACPEFEQDSMDNGQIRIRGLKYEKCLRSLQIQEG